MYRVCVCGFVAQQNLPLTDAVSSHFSRQLRVFLSAVHSVPTTTIRFAIFNILPGALRATQAAGI